MWFSLSYFEYKWHNNKKHTTFCPNRFKSTRQTLELVCEAKGESRVATMQPYETIHWNTDSSWCGADDTHTPTQYVTYHMRNTNRAAFWNFIANDFRKSSEKQCAEKTNRDEVLRRDTRANMQRNVLKLETKYYSDGLREFSMRTKTQKGIQTEAAATRVAAAKT